MGGKVEALCLSDKKGVRKLPVDSARFLTGAGIETDAHAEGGIRQVSLLALTDIETVRAKIPTIGPGAFAENLIVSGLDLSFLGIGSKLQFGGQVVLRITQIGKVCHAPCNIAKITGDCIMPRLGLFAEVLQGGTVSVGDSVSVLETVKRPPARPASIKNT